MFRYRLIFVIKWSTNKLLPKVNDFIKVYRKYSNVYQDIGFSNTNGNGAYRIHLKLVKQNKLK